MSLEETRCGVKKPEPIDEMMKHTRQTSKSILELAKQIEEVLFGRGALGVNKLTTPPNSLLSTIEDTKCNLDEVEVLLRDIRNDLTNRKFVEPINIASFRTE